MIDLDPRPLNNIISLISRHYYAREGYLIIPSAYTTVTQYQQLVISDFCHNKLEQDHHHDMLKIGG